MKLFALTISILLYAPMWGQSKLDSLRMNTRTMDRPITVFKGELRINGGYRFDIFNNRYDGAGEKINLSAMDGKAAFQDALFMNMRYGITDFLDIEVNLLDFKKMTVRETPVDIIEDVVWEISRLTETVGNEDLLLKLNMRWPGLPRVVDVGLSPGISFPTARHGEQQPQHGYNLPQSSLGIDSPDAVYIDYHQVYKWGAGVTRSYLEGMVKWRGQNVALSGAYSAHFPLKTGKAVYWIHRLDKAHFSYRSVEYEYDWADFYALNLMAEYQAYSWLDILMGFNHRTWKNGWEGMSGEIRALPERKLANLNLGYEVIITPKMWLRQWLRFPVSGKNTMSSFVVDTKFVYSLSFK
ncbi:MAG: hypothetical protein OEX02_15815 [Cyclobacteriaceae bacterium]|nr:hypothetical protein [Cyclobacteriaceae bacterium]